MKQVIHRAAAITAFLCIAIFFLSSIYVELLESKEVIAATKKLIVTPGLFILIPAMIITGATGFALAPKSKIGAIGKKKKRMPFIAMNGLLILVPAAIYLNMQAARGDFDLSFYLVQLLELLAGAINLFLMTLNIRDGMKITGRLKPQKA